ncbi:DUF2141 domain-containing protein [Gracilimonas mengyeensis]|uniref:Uncharacterized conserved protein, DUF2141 family n=1 Tax=Gracilimonas mengyeensis TaxID=1302730 RepID=A0A521ADX9_9BACT|nr:DUF2141 domain-containing protein [Gracilimonas mengyeensis]SMO33024.1 Uncharacterized conserved protein, DUF2141 family [Gracilimonas mengyeensis]
MRTVFLLTFFISVLSLDILAQEISYPDSMNQQKKAEFSLVISGISEVEGELRVAVFNSEEAYSKKENPLHAVVLTVDNSELTWKQDLPYGEYSIAVYHDKNENGELDTNLLGIPKEAYGFSNNARGRFGPAKWDDAMILVNHEQEKTIISLK